MHEADEPNAFVLPYAKLLAIAKHGGDVDILAEQSPAAAVMKTSRSCLAGLH